MRILVHLGLNKCASTAIQQALTAAQARLRRQGVFYAVEGQRPAQYGLSRHYGFGPDVAGVTPRSLGWLVAEAERRGCDRMIVSSEYLSLCRPAAIAAFAADLARLGAEARFLLFSRPLDPKVLNRWTAKAGAEDRALLDARLGGWVHHFGYDPDEIGHRPCPSLPVAAGAATREPAPGAAPEAAAPACAEAAPA